MVSDIEKYRKLLLDEQERLAQELSIERAAEETQPASDGEQLDAGDAAYAGEAADIAAELLDLRSQRVGQVNVALQKIDNETYGICENCDEEIALKRLDADPAAIYCIECATKLEGDIQTPTL